MLVGTAYAVRPSKCVVTTYYLTPRVSAVPFVAGVRRGEPRFAEPTWVAGVVRFGIKNK